MQVIDYHEAIFASELTTNAKITALAISKYYNWKEDKMCWPSNKTLAKATSLSIRSIVRAKNELVNAGYLVSHRRFNDSNVYQTTTPGQSGNYPMTKVLTNNEVNNEENNETMKESDFQSSSLVNFNNIHQEDVDTTFEVVRDSMSAAEADRFMSW
jgi:DNA-binding transcriptional MocR family regulator